MASLSEAQSLNLNSSGYGSTSNTKTSSNKDANKLPPPVSHVSSKPNIRKSLKIILASSWINILLIFMPFGYLAHKFEWSDTWIFILNFLALIPLAKLYDFATVEVSLAVGQSFGCLLNATFGNAVELIVAIIALSKGEIRVVQASILGAIISNLLLIIGLCFFIGGIFYDIQVFNKTNAQTTSSLLTLACIGLVIPAAFNFAVNSVGINGDTELLKLSHGTAILLMMIYILYIYFQVSAIITTISVAQHYFI
jgi:Ca2+:H+ antiporter